MLDKSPLSTIHAALWVSSRVDSYAIAISASMNWIAWCCAIGTPNVLRSSEYARLSSSARRITPAAIHGRERSNVFIAILKPLSSVPTSALFGILTSSKITSVVFDARWPILFSLRPGLTPGVLASTTKQAMPLCFIAGSNVASTVYQLATPPFVIQRFWPSSTYSSPCFVTRVRMPATSLPASGSLQQYAQNISSDVSWLRYFFFCSSLPAIKSGIAPSEFAAIDVLTPAQPNATSSCTRQLSTQLPPRPPYSAPTSMFIRPVSHAFFITSRGNSPVSSQWPALGMISLRVNSRAVWIRACCSSVRLRSRAMASALYQPFFVGDRATDS